MNTNQLPVGTALFVVGLHSASPDGTKVRGRRTGLVQGEVYAWSTEQPDQIALVLRDLDKDGILFDTPHAPIPATDTTLAVPGTPHDLQPPHAAGLITRQHALASCVSTTVTYQLLRNRRLATLSPQSVWNRWVESEASLYQISGESDGILLGADRIVREQGTVHSIVVQIEEVIPAGYRCVVEVAPPGSTEFVVIWDSELHPPEGTKVGDRIPRELFEVAGRGGLRFQTRMFKIGDENTPAPTGRITWLATWSVFSWSMDFTLPIRLQLDGLTQTSEEALDLVWPALIASSEKLINLAELLKAVQVVELGEEIPAGARILEIVSDSPASISIGGVTVLDATTQTGGWVASGSVSVATAGTLASSVGTAVVKYTRHPGGEVPFVVLSAAEAGYDDKALREEIDTARAALVAAQIAVDEAQDEAIGASADTLAVWRRHLPEIPVDTPDEVEDPTDGAQWRQGIVWSDGRAGVFTPTNGLSLIDERLDSGVDRNASWASWTLTATEPFPGRTVQMYWRQGNGGASWSVSYQDAEGATQSISRGVGATGWYEIGLPEGAEVTRIHWVKPTGSRGGPREVRVYNVAREWVTYQERRRTTDQGLVATLTADGSAPYDPSAGETEATLPPTLTDTRITDAGSGVVITEAERSILYELQASQASLGIVRPGDTPPTVGDGYPGAWYLAESAEGTIEQWAWSEVAGAWVRVAGGGEGAQGPEGPTGTIPEVATLADLPSADPTPDPPYVRIADTGQMLHAIDWHGLRCWVGEGLGAHLRVRALLPTPISEGRARLGDPVIEALRGGRIYYQQANQVLSLGRSRPGYRWSVTVDLQGADGLYQIEDMTSPGVLFAPEDQGSLGTPTTPATVAWTSTEEIFLQVMALSDLTPGLNATIEVREELIPPEEGSWVLDGSQPLPDPGPPLAYVRGSVDPAHDGLYVRDADGQGYTHVGQLIPPGGT